MLLGNNHVMVPGSAPAVSCGKAYTFAEVRLWCSSASARCFHSHFMHTCARLVLFDVQWIALGYDAGTTVSEQPPTSEIIALAKAVLGMA
jgi:hypothetical protein